jgi:hypothetical protein
MSDEIEKAAGLLKAVLGNEITAEEAIAAWPKATKDTDPIVETACEQLYHYASDKDIHTREPSYEARQLQGIRACLDALLRRKGELGVS